MRGTILEIEKSLDPIIVTRTNECDRECKQVQVTWWSVVLVAVTSPHVVLRHVGPTSRYA